MTPRLPVSWSTTSLRRRTTPRLSWPPTTAADSAHGHRRRRHRFGLRGCHDGKHHDRRRRVGAAAAPVSQATPSDGRQRRRGPAAPPADGGAVAGVAVIAAIAVGAYVYMRRAKESADSAPMAEVEVLGTITGAVESGALKDAAPVPSAPPLMPPPPPEPAQSAPPWCRGWRLAGAGC